MLLVETRRTGLALRDKLWWPGSKPAARHSVSWWSLACVILSTRVWAEPKMLLDDYVEQRIPTYVLFPWTLPVVM